MKQSDKLPKTGLKPEPIELSKIDTNLNILEPQFVHGSEKSYHSRFDQTASVWYMTSKLAECELASGVAQVSFDYIVIGAEVSATSDLYTLLARARAHCHAQSRIIVEYENPVRFSQMFKRSRGAHRSTYRHSHLILMARCSGLELVTSGFTSRAGRFAHFKKILALFPAAQLFRRYRWMMLRPIVEPAIQRDVTVSVVIPCKNEAGNIERAITSCPQLGVWTELIFVEGNSSDDTSHVIERMMQKYPEKQIQLVTQSGKGKADAVRTAFASARGQMLMILDGDLTVDPSELERFYQTLLCQRAEFVNGARLFYHQERGAMTFLAFLANHFFAYLLSWIMRQPVSDTLCGTKVLWKKDYERLAAQRSFLGMTDPFGDFDLLFGAARLGLKIVDVPIHYKARTYGTSNIHRFKDVWLLLWLSARAYLFFWR